MWRSLHIVYSQILYQFLTFTQNLKRSRAYRKANHPSKWYWPQRKSSFTSIHSQGWNHSPTPLSFSTRHNKLYTSMPSSDWSPLIHNLHDFHAALKFYLVAAYHRNQCLSAAVPLTSLLSDHSGNGLVQHLWKLILCRYACNKFAHIRSYHIQIDVQYDFIQFLLVISDICFRSKQTTLLTDNYLTKISLVNILL